MTDEPTGVSPTPDQGAPAPRLALDRVTFTYRGATAPALRDATFAVRGSLGIVGESGSGKSTTLNLLLGLLRPSSGRVLLDGEELRGAARIRALRRAVQPVFQDPYASLDPRMRVDRIVGEPLASLGIASGAAAKQKVRDALADVGLDDDTLTRYPHEFSGGQRQRIAIARALVTDPAILIADEPVSALDVTTRIDVIALLDRLRRGRGLSVVMVSHDVSVVAALCDDTVVLKDGEVVEQGPTMQVLHSPAHPYTVQLISAIATLPTTA